MGEAASVHQRSIPASELMLEPHAQVTVTADLPPARREAPRRP
jgi:hypothetical protein